MVLIRSIFRSWIPIALLFSGAALRISVWIQNRSLFIDEANLALNIVELPFAGFFGGLFYDQYAPPLFMVLQKLAWLSGPENELSLRIWPLLAGLGSLWVFWLLCRHFLEKVWILWWPCLIVAFHPSFLQYATECKQYSTDMLVALLLLWMAVKRPPWILGALGGVISVWCSMPSVFVLCGVGLYYLYSDRKLPTLAMILSWMVSFGLYFFLILNAETQTEALQAYHRAYFLPWLPNEQFLEILYSILHAASGYTVVAQISGGILLMIGLYFLFRQNKARLVLLSAPVLSCLLASMLGYYSLIPRLTLFFIPILILIMAIGADHWLTGFPRWSLLLLAVMLVSMAGLRTSYRYFFEKYSVDDFRSVLAYADKYDRPGDSLLLGLHSVPVFRFYTHYHEGRQKYSFGKAQHMAWGERPDRHTLLSKFETLPPRLWVFYSTILSQDAYEKMMLHVAETKAVYRLEKQYSSKGSHVFLWVE